MESWQKRQEFMMLVPQNVKEHISSNLGVVRISDCFWEPNYDDEWANNKAVHCEDGCYIFNCPLEREDLDGCFCNDIMTGKEILDGADLWDFRSGTEPDWDKFVSYFDRALCRYTKTS